VLDIAIIEGVRTPFARILGPLAAVHAAELGRLVVGALLDRAAVQPDQIDQVVFGNAGTWPCQRMRPTSRA
jgi:acetyl-CoA acetyltransferase